MSSSMRNDRLVRMFDRLSADSRYRRFLSPKQRLESRELAYLTNLDYVDHDALAAGRCPRRLDRWSRPLCPRHGVAAALWDNLPARALLRRLGFRAHGSDHDVVELALALPAGPQVPSAAIR
jgi:hypothetical protein